MQPLQEIKLVFQEEGKLCQLYCVYLREMSLCSWHCKPGTKLLSEKRKLVAFLIFFFLSVTQ